MGGSFFYNYLFYLEKNAFHSWSDGTKLRKLWKLYLAEERSLTITKNVLSQPVLFY